MLELKQIDENTIKYNGRTFKHTGEDVRSPMEQNVQDEVRYSVDYCKANDVYVLVPEFNQFERVAEICNQKWINGHNLWHHHKKEAAYNIARKSVYSKSELRHDASIVIDFATFIAHNTPQQDEQTYPWQKEFVIEAFQRCNTGYIHNLNTGGTYGPNNTSLQDFLFKRDGYISVESEGAAIFKIRRLADNAVFTLGDKVQTANDGALEIKGIEICGNSIVFKFAIGSLNATEGQPYKLPTLAEVFKKVQPRFYLSSANTIETNLNADFSIERYHSQLSTSKQCEQIQAFIALRNIADCYNEEASWVPTVGETCYAHDYSQNGIWSAADYVLDKEDLFIPMVAFFKQREHAEQAINILKEAGLLDALKG